MSEQERHQEIGRIVEESTASQHALAACKSKVLGLAQRLESAAMHMRSVASGADYRQNFPALTSVPTENELISACS